MPRRNPAGLKPVATCRIGAGDASGHVRRRNFTAHRADHNRAAVGNQFPQIDRQLSRRFGPCRFAAGEGERLLNRLDRAARTVRAHLAGNVPARDMEFPSRFFTGSGGLRWRAGDRPRARRVCVGRASVAHLMPKDPHLPLQAIDTITFMRGDFASLSRGAQRALGHRAGFRRPSTATPRYQQKGPDESPRKQEAVPPRPHERASGHWLEGRFDPRSRNACMVRSPQPLADNQRRQATSDVPFSAFRFSKLKDRAVLSVSEAPPSRSRPRTCCALRGLRLAQSVSDMRRRRCGLCPIT